MGQHIIEAGGAKATIHTDGGRLASLQIFDQELLITDGPKPTRWGSFPMIPWCGRLANGNLAWNGEIHEFPLTSPPNANHGFTHTSMWDVAKKTDNSIELIIGLDKPWPFGGVVTQKFKIEDGSLFVEAEITAQDVSMPVMVGWHPWFKKTLENGSVADLSFKADAIYELNEDQIPTGKLLSVPDGPWDNCFVGMKQKPVIAWPGHCELSFDSNLDHWVIYTQPEHGLCVEPQSGQPNQLNTDPRIIGPKESFSGSMTLKWAES